MRLTRYTDNALRALIYISLHDDRPSRIADIARRMGMSEDHTAKVIARLAELGFVTTLRGRSGGVRLARPASEITVGHVVRSTEDNLDLVECFDAEHNQCPIAPVCGLAPVLDQALTAFLTVLDKCTLAQISERPRALQKLLIA
jgi:Rrf2 family protein